MATHPYRLTLVLRLSDLDAGTTQRAVTIAAETADEAVELADIYCTGLRRQSLCSAQLTDVSGALLWSGQGHGEPGVDLPRKDQP